MTPAHNFTGDETSTPFGIKTRTFILAASGTWGGGTLTVEVSFDGGTNWISLEEDAIVFQPTDNFVRVVDLAPCSIRFVFSGSSGADLDIFLA